MGGSSPAMWHCPLLHAPVTLMAFCKRGVHSYVNLGGAALSHSLNTLPLPHRTKSPHFSQLSLHTVQLQGCKCTSILSMDLRERTQRIQCRGFAHFITQGWQAGVQGRAALHLQAERMCGPGYLPTMQGEFFRCFMSTFLYNQGHPDVILTYRLDRRGVMNFTSSFPSSSPSLEAYLSL